MRGRGDSHDLEYRQDGTANAILTPNGGRCGMGVGAIAHCDVMPTMMNGANTPAGHNARSGHSKDSYIVPVGFVQNQRDEVRQTEVIGALQAEPGMKQQTFLAVPPAPTFAVRTANTKANGHGISGEVTHTLDGANGQAVMSAMQVRRLTPVECERLQSFPDNYTNIPWRGKPESPDGPRYKALGNSMCCNVMRWIGERIEQVDDVIGQMEIAA